MQKMTLTEFKEKLPDVRVQNKGNHLVGEPKGRKNKFCSLHLFYYNIKTGSVDVAWETVLRCYNEDREVIIG